METVKINELELNEFVGVKNPQQRCRGTFPMLSANGTKDTATVYFELQPGDQLGRHTDSAEELLFILEGEVEVEVGGEIAKASSKSITLVPAMVPHNIVNTGHSTAKVIGFFGGTNNIVATFEEAMTPINSNVFNTAMMES